MMIFLIFLFHHRDSLSWRISPLGHLHACRMAHMQGASLLPFSYIRRPLLLIWVTIFLLPHGLSIYHAIFLVFSHFCEPFVISSHLVFNKKALEEIFCCLVVICSYIYMLAYAIGGQGNKLLCFGEIYCIFYIDFMSFPFAFGKFIHFSVE